MFGRKLDVSISEIKTIRSPLSRSDLISDLKRSPILDWVPASIDSNDVLPTVQELAPLAPDIVEWMQIATANNAVLQGTAEDYARAGSMIAVGSGDAYSPGASTTGIYAVSITADTLRSRGQGQCVIGGQTFSVPAGGKTTIIGRDFLAWASIPDVGTEPLQWIMSLMNWLELARSPINTKIRFASLSGPSATGLVAPQFLVVSTAMPSPLVILTIGTESDKPQTLTLTGRALGDYTTELFTLPVSIPEGEIQTRIFVRGIPTVQPFVLQMQPEDQTQTVLTSVTTQPV